MSVLWYALSSNILGCKVQTAPFETESTQGSWTGFFELSLLFKFLHDVISKDYLETTTAIVVPWGSRRKSTRALKRVVIFNIFCSFGSQWSLNCVSGNTVLPFSGLRGVLDVVFSYWRTIKPNLMFSMSVWCNPEGSHLKLIDSNPSKIKHKECIYLY